MTNEYSAILSELHPAPRTLQQLTEPLGMPSLSLTLVAFAAPPSPPMPLPASLWQAMKQHILLTYLLTYLPTYLLTYLGDEAAHPAGIQDEDGQRAQVGA